MKHLDMKTTKILLFATFAFSVLSFYSCAKAGIGGPSYTIDGNANGAQVVPTSTSSASALISGNFDGSKNTMSGVIKWSGLSGKPTAIHIHNGGEGRNGYATFNLPIPKGVKDSLNFISSFTESQEGGVAGSGYYFDIHTTAYPTGEIRGQIFAH